MIRKRKYTCVGCGFTRSNGNGKHEILFSVFKRPFCDVFMKFCCEKFDIGVWSSRKMYVLQLILDSTCCLFFPYSFLSCLLSLSSIKYLPSPVTLLLVTYSFCTRLICFTVLLLPILNNLEFFAGKMFTEWSILS